MSSSVKMSSKHQIVVPREAREDALGLRAGDRLLVTVVGRRHRDARSNLAMWWRDLEGLLSGSAAALTANCGQR